MKVRIEAESEDPHLRYHGFSVDETMYRDFWKSQPEKIIATQGSPFGWETEVTEQAQAIIYGNSGYAKPGAPAGPWPWHTRIFIDDLLAAEGDVGRDQHLRAQRKEPPPGVEPADWGWWLPMLIAGLAGLLAVAGVVVYRETTK